MQKTLILWDIDGTILHSTGAGMKALNAALETVFGIAGSFEGIEFAGRTDPLIIRQIFARFGIEYTPANFDRYIEGYVAALPGMLAANHARVLPGVAEILGRAAGHPGVAQGLLTGNLRRGAEIKLGFHRLWDYFPVGAFADDSEIRNELGPHAHRRARGHWGDEFPLDRVWVVGDTPHDVACARALGARALAVATGMSSASVLASHGPDAVLESLARPEDFWAAVLE
jgi:phosphoglycolate phosphatase